MWNPELYNKYGKERMQPSVDLVNRIRDNNFKRILDVDCVLKEVLENLKRSYASQENGKVLFPFRSFFGGQKVSITTHI